MLMLKKRWRIVESWVKMPKRVGSGRMKRRRREEVEEIVGLHASRLLLHSPSRFPPRKLISHLNHLPS